MADTDVSKPAEPPKPVHIGGDSIADRILPHLKKIVVGVIILAVVLSVFFGYRAWKQGKQADETVKVAAVLAVAQRPVLVEGATADPNVPSFKDAKERAIAVLDEIAKQGTDELDGAFRAGLLLDAGKIDEAITEYKKGTEGTSIEAVAAREGLGIALEAKAMASQDPAARQRALEEALAAFVAMQPIEDGPRRGYALYHQGRVQQVLGKAAEAKTLFEQAKAAAADNDELLQLIETRLASLGAS